MIEGQFPAFEKVIALTGDKVVALDRERLVHGIRRVSLLSSERSRAVRLSLGPGKLDLARLVPRPGRGKESLSAEYKGDPVRSGQRAYLRDFLGVAGTTAVSLELKDADSQGMLRPAAAARPTTATWSCHAAVGMRRVARPAVRHVAGRLDCVPCGPPRGRAGDGAD